jgi:hypothetical protein
MNPLLIFFGMFLLAMPVLPPDTNHAPVAVGGKSKWVVLKTSSLNIAGRTNVNRFSCGVSEYAESDTLCFLPERTSARIIGIPLCGKLKLNIDQFDCRSRMMTGEFKKALRYEQYPQLTIRFVSLQKMPCLNEHPESIKGCVEIELAGICKLFEIDYSANRSGNCAVELTGSRSLSFHDFGLKPPRKMGGLIRVNDSLDVHFTLCLRRIE